MLTVISLSREIDLNSVYSDTPMSRDELSQLFNVGKTTIWKYTDIAWLKAPNYREDLPKGDHLGYVKGTRILSNYQVWLLSRIDFLMKRNKNRRMTELYIESNVTAFSKARFTALYTTIKDAEEKAS